MECSGIFQNTLFPALFQKPEQTFLLYLLWESGRAPWSKSHSIVRTALHQDCVPLECWTLRVVLMETPAVGQLQFRFSLPSTGLPVVISAGKSSVFSCWSLQSWVQWFMNPRRVVDFYLLLRESGDFRASYTWSQTPEGFCCCSITKSVRKSREKSHPRLNLGRWSILP